MILADPNYDPHASTLDHFSKILGLTMAEETTGPEEEEKEIEQEDDYDDLKIIISCDASITKNPNGQASTGIVVRFPDKKPLIISRLCHKKTITNNQAEYDAVFEAISYIEGNLATFMAHDMHIEIRTDSQLVANQISGRFECNDKTLKNKHELIQEKLDMLVTSIGLTITIVWFARNSTQDLKSANNAAQDELNVKNH